MGTVTFNTDVTKTVDINKTVNLTVDKTVFSFVELTGSLATAEASADALGGAGFGGGNLAVSYVVDESGSIFPDDFDSQIAAVQASIDDLRTQFPDGGDVDVTVQIVGFSDGAESAMFDLHDPVLDDVATGTPLEVQAAGLTNIEAGLDEAVDFFTGAGADSGVMIFLSDGAATAGGPFLDEVDELELLGVTREAFGFGAADLATLNQIDSQGDAVIFDDVNDIIGIIDVQFDGDVGPALAETDVFAQVDANGAFSFAEALAAIG